VGLVGRGDLVTWGRGLRGNRGIRKGKKGRVDGEGNRSSNFSAAKLAIMIAIS